MAQFHHSSFYPNCAMMAYSHYYFPVFSTYWNDVPITHEAGVMEAIHIRDLYYCYADKHNNHLSPYNDLHPDPLERRILEGSDVEVYKFDNHEVQWFLGVNTSHALHGAYHHALQVFGDAVQPETWDRRYPWNDYDHSTRLAELGIPYIPKPTSFREGLYHLPFETFEDLQRKVHHNNFYAMCLTASAIVINAIKANRRSNIVHAGYMRGSPGFIAAHRYWCRLMGYPVYDRSEDDQSTADFEQLAQEQQESADAMVTFDPPVAIYPSEREDASPLTESELRVTNPELGGGPFTSANHELVRSMGRRWYDIESCSDNATTGSPPLVRSGILDNQLIDIDELIERLGDIAAFQAVEGPNGGNDGTTQPDEGSPSTPAAFKKNALEPSFPLTSTTRDAPSLSWEDYWSTLRGKGLTRQEGSLVDRVILMYPNSDYTA